MFGDNSDVLGGGNEPYTAVMGRGHGTRWRKAKDIMDATLGSGMQHSLRMAFVQGQTPWACFASVQEDLQQQQRIAEQVADSMRRGDSVGRAFEILRPLAKRPHPPQGTGARSSEVLKMFAIGAIHQLIHAEETELLSWFERWGEAPARPLRRMEGLAGSGLMAGNLPRHFNRAMVVLFR